jgi:hypothetical protein
MNKAKMIEKLSADEIAMMKNAEKILGEGDQDWERGTTTFIFDDGSTIVFHEGEYTIE